MAIDIGTILSQWESVGVFSYVLPFLLIFAVVFGILTTTNILGKEKPVHVIVALVIGLMALQLNFVQLFFREVFPRLGIGISVLLVLMILAGLFIPDDERRYWGWGLGAVAVVIFIVIITQSFDAAGWYSTYLGSDSIGYLVGAVLLIGIVIAVAASGGHKDGKPKENASYNPMRG
ncbi:MAG: hypothetical protein WCK90_00625 [archaeon]